MKISSYVLVVVAAVASPFVSGCDDRCDPGFERVDGACVDSREKFAGRWTVTDTCTASGSSSYSVSVSLSSEAGNLQITNFWGSFTNPVSATLVDGELNVPRQVPDGDGYYIIGHGSLQETGDMTWTYDITDENIPEEILTDSCTSTWTRP